MKRDAWCRAAIAGLTLAASLASGVGPADAAATPITVLNGQVPYTGQASHTHTFIEHVFEANIPDILAGAGKIKIGFSIESTTTAEVRALSTHRVTVEGDLKPGQPLTVQTSQDSVDIVGLPELVLNTRPVLRVVFDYEPEDTDAFECSPFQLTGAEPVATGDGDAKCGRFELTIPEPARLMEAQFAPPYAGGSVALQDEREVFTIPVCARLAGLLGIGPLEDICGIRLEAFVAARLSAGPTGGFGATTSLATDRVLPGGAIDRGGLRVSDPEVVRWPSPDPVTQSFTVPCLPEGSPLYYRLDNNAYASQVDEVTVQAQIDFVLAGATVKEIAAGTPFNLLGEGNTIPVTATHGSLVPQIGTMGADDLGPLVGPGGPYSGAEGSAIQLTAVGAGPNGSLGECDPAAVTFEWSFDDGTTASGATVQKTFADNVPSPHQATLTATDRLGNATAVPFTVAVSNVAPTAAITSPTSPPIVPIGSPIDFVATATDPGSQDVLSYDWAFGDGTTRSVSTLSRTDSVRHSYSAACLCTVTLDVRDPEAAAPRQSVDVVVFDPAGKVTGGGGFISDQSSVGVAPGTGYRMNASVQYDAGAAVPKGLTDVDIASAGKSVRATGFEFLVVRGKEATWEGTATVNGAAGYRFRATLVMASDLTPTATSLTVWRPGSSSLAHPDLRVGGPIDNGHIKTH